MCSINQCVDVSSICFLQEYMACFSASRPSLAALLLTQSHPLCWSTALDTKMECSWEVVGDTIYHVSQGLSWHHSKTDLNATRGVIDIRRSSTIRIIFLAYKPLIFHIDILFIWIERIASVCLRKGYQSYDIVFRHQHAACECVWLWSSNGLLLQGSGHFWRKPTVAPRTSRSWCFCLEPQLMEQARGPGMM